MHLRARSGFAVVLAAVALLLAAAPALAAPAWLLPKDISAGVDNVPFDAFFGSAGTRVATDAKGNAIAVWLQVTGGGTPVITPEWAEHPAGGSWSAPKDVAAGVTPAGGPPGYANAQIALAMNDSGLAVVAYRYPSTGGPAPIFAAVKEAGAEAFSAPVQLSADGQGTFDPDVAVNNAGTAIVTWDEYSGPGPNWQVASRTRPAGGSFAAQQNITRGADFVTYTPVVALDDAGNAVVAWRDNNSNVGQTQVFMSYRQAGASGFQQNPIPLADVAGDHPDLTVDHNGRFTVVFESNTRIQALSRTAAELKAIYDNNSNPNTIPSDRATLDPSNGQVTARPVVSANPVTGVTAAIWTGCATACSGGNNSQVWIALGTPGATPVWAPPTPLTPLSPVAWGPVVASDPIGSLIALFTDGTDINARTRPPGEGSIFGPTFYLHPSGGAPSAPALDFDDEGNAVATWLRTVNAGGPDQKTFVQATAYDAAPPKLSDFKLPSGAVSGASQAFSATVADRWSLPSTSWNFGDGTTAVGTAVNHTYAAPGTYQVTVAAVDEVGNTVAETKPVTVLAPDGDGDGERNDKDCDDANAAVNHAATEILGNTVDENCDGFKAPFPRIDTPLNNKWGPHKKFTRILVLNVIQVPAGAKVELRCLSPKEKKGKKAKKVCPFKLVKGKINSKRKADLLKQLSKKQRKIKTGATIEVRVTLPGAIGKVSRYPITGKLPSVKRMCIMPGAKTPQKTCPDLV